MDRRGLLAGLALLALMAAAGQLRADDGSSGRGRGRGRGGDDDKDDDDDDRDDDDDDDGDDDDDEGDSSGSGSGSAQGGGSGPGGDSMPAVEADTLVIRYADGSAERIRGGRYQRLDGGGRVVETRAATRGDAARLGGARPGSGAEVLIRIDTRSGNMETVDRRGWRERIAGGVYLLTDPKGNVVRRRAVRGADLGRIRALAGG
jgi:hypothetical protein